MTWNISEDMMPFGGEYVMIWKEYSRALNFFYICQTHELPCKSSWIESDNDQL